MRTPHASWSSARHCVSCHSLVSITDVQWQPRVCAGTQTCIQVHKPPWNPTQTNSLLIKDRLIKGNSLISVIKEGIIERLVHGDKNWSGLSVCLHTHTRAHLHSPSRYRTSLLSMSLRIKKEFHFVLGALTVPNQYVSAERVSRNQMFALLSVIRSFHVLWEESGHSWVAPSNRLSWWPGVRQSFPNTQGGITNKGANQ